MAKRRKSTGPMEVIGPSEPGQKPLRFRKGGLHASTGTPAGQKIPAGKVAAAAAGRLGPKAKKQAQFFQNVLKKGQRTAAGGSKKIPTKRAQFGVDTLVTRPTRFLTGEGNRPERVRISPIRGGLLGNIPLVEPGRLGALRAGAGPAGTGVSIINRLREGAGLTLTPRQGRGGSRATERD